MTNGAWPSTRKSGFFFFVWCVCWILTFARLISFCKNRTQVSNSKKVRAVKVSFYIHWPSSFSNVGVLLFALSFIDRPVPGSNKVVRLLYTIGPSWVQFTTNYLKKKCLASVLTTLVRANIPKLRNWERKAAALPSLLKRHFKWVITLEDIISVSLDMKSVYVMPSCLLLLLLLMLGMTTTCVQSADALYLCMKNCEQCKSMYGAYFEVRH